MTLLYESYFSRAQTNSDVFVLTKKDLDEVLTHYPQIRKKILETAEERQRMVAERAKAFAKKKEEDKKREEENKLKVFFKMTAEILVRSFAYRHTLQTKPDFARLGCFSTYVLSKTKSVTPRFLYF